MRFRILSDHISCIVLTLAVAGGGAIFASAADLQTNRVVDSRPIDGEVVDLMNTNWQLISISSTQAILIRSTVNQVGYTSFEKPGPKSSLRLFLTSSLGSVKYGGGVHGFGGLMYVEGDSRKQAFVETNWVDELASADNVRIVVMAADNGPIYTSTNSGMTWTTISSPGEYRFPLAVVPVGYDNVGYLATATIHPPAQNQAPNLLPKSNWYSISSGPNNRTLILTEDISNRSPALSITSSNGQAVVSWPSEFTNYVLQISSDLGSTNWVDATNPVNTIGSANQVIVPNSASNAFYRLRSQ